MKPGIYFDLPDEDYFGAKALGSTDLSKLARFPADWWYSSPWNPDRVETRKKGYDLGAALHILLLEGEEAYRGKIVLSAFDEYRTKIAKAWKQDQEDAGLIILKHEEDAACRHMAALVSNHPDTKAITTGLKELAVFWEDDDGILKRCKFDAILPSFCVDLKTYGGANTQGRDAFDTAMRMIAMRNYDVQRAHYEEGRHQLRKLWEAGAIFGGTDHQLADLTAIASRTTWAWVWLFYQRPDHKAGFAPVVMPIGVQPNDASMRSGRAKIDVAIKNFKSYRDRFSFETPWAQVNPLRWADESEFMPWMADYAPPQQFPDIEGEDS